MMIFGGTDAMHSKLFMGAFLGTTFDWFISDVIPLAQLE